ncbi:MAG: hypothetical protein ABW221_16740 [Vicinamibacteria bacterium]
MHTKLLFSGALLTAALAAPAAFAVGGGIPFVFREGNVPGGTQPNPVVADSEDLTYHACGAFVVADSNVARGSFWVASYQDAVGGVDSQINFIGAAGYNVYGIFRLAADECMGPQPTCNNLTRRSYGVTAGQIELFLDPAADTVLGLAGCQVAVAGNGDDTSLGMAPAIISGQITETNDQANGDFDVIFANWAFTAAGQQLYRDGNNNPLAAQILQLNANVTRLQGPLSNDHRPEGSGNFFWVD